MLRPLFAAVTMALLLAGCTSAGPSAQEEFLSAHGLAGKQAAQIIDHLDRLGGDDRPDDLMASVRPDELLLSDDESEVALPMPDDRFYLSVAPYVAQTHDCFFHSLTTCQGELTGEDIQVTIIDSAGEVLVDEQVTTFENGFAGFWLPRDVRGTIQVTRDGLTAESDFSTDDDSPSCMTTLKLT